MSLNTQKIKVFGGQASNLNINVLESQKTEWQVANPTYEIVSTHQAVTERKGYFYLLLLVVYFPNIP